MRIVTLNIRHGGGKRIEQLAQYLLMHDAGVSVLTEIREDKSVQMLRSMLATRGFVHDASPSFASADQNSVCIFAVEPFLKRTYLPFSAADDEFACATLSSVYPAPQLGC